jgi:GntR family transcriptional regulator
MMFGREARPGQTCAGGSMESETPIRQPSLASQVLKILTQRILDGTYAASAQFPPENMLAKEFGVSRSTIRSALDALAARKLLIRQQGVGTFVSQLSRLSNPINHYIDFRELIAASGCEPGYEQLSAEIIRSTPALAGFLNLDPEDEVLRVHKVFTADGKAVIHAVNHIPVKIFIERLPIAKSMEGDVTQPFFDFFERYCGRTIEYAIADIEAQTARDCEIFEQMRVGPLVPVIIFRETAYTKSEEPVVHSVDYYPGDGMKFSLIRRRLSV